MTRISTRAWLLAGATSLAALALPAHAATAATAAATGPIGNADDIIVTATKVNEATPITASVKTAEPQSIISRSIIEDSVAPSDDFMDIASLPPVVWVPTFSTLLSLIPAPISTITRPTLRSPTKPTGSRFRSTSAMTNTPIGTSIRALASLNSSC